MPQHILFRTTLVMWLAMAWTGWGAAGGLDDVTPTRMPTHPAQSRLQGRGTWMRADPANSRMEAPTFHISDLPPIDFSRISPLAAVSCVAGMLAMAVGGIWLIVRAFLVSWVWGLLVLFVPFAQFVFLFVHWPRAWKPFLVSLVGLILFMTGGTSLVHGTSTALSSAVQHMPTDAPRAVRQPAPQGAALPDPSVVAARPLATVKDVQVGARLTDVLRELGAPKARLEQGDLIVLRYPECTLVSEDGTTVTHIEETE